MDFRSSTPVEHNNLQHALANDCTDPDCEIHNPSIGVREEVVSATNLAFYIAGACAMHAGYDAFSPSAHLVNFLRAYEGLAKEAGL